MRSVRSSTSAVTNGLPSRSPPIHEPIRRNERQLGQRRAGVAALQFVLERAVQQGHLGQERLLEERQAIRHFVEHVELLEPQHAGLPQREHGAARTDSSLAACSCGVRRVRSRACSSCSICISRSRTLLRWTSVGCAVSTGTTTPSRKNPASDSERIPRPRRRDRAHGPGCHRPAVRHRSRTAARGGCCAGLRRGWPGARSS